MIEAISCRIDVSLALSGPIDILEFTLMWFTKIKLRKFHLTCSCVFDESGDLRLKRAWRNVSQQGYIVIARASVLLELGI